MAAPRKGVRARSAAGLTRWWRPVRGRVEADDGLGRPRVGRAQAMPHADVEVEVVESEVDHRVELVALLGGGSRRIDRAVASVVLRPQGHPRRREEGQLARRLELDMSGRRTAAADGE